MSTLRRVTLGRLDGVLARITLGRLGGQQVEDGGGSSGVRRLEMHRREAWRKVRRRPSTIAMMRQAAIEARAAEMAQSRPAKEPKAGLVPQPAEPAKVAVMRAPTEAQLDGFKRSLERQNAELSDIPLSADQIALDFLSGEWLRLSLETARRREDDAVAFLLISM